LEGEKKKLKSICRTAPRAHLTQMSAGRGKGGEGKDRCLFQVWPCFVVGLGFILKKGRLGQAYDFTNRHFKGEKKGLASQRETASREEDPFYGENRLTGRR